MFPEWFVLGALIAGGSAVIFACVFVLGERLYPSAPVSGGNDDAGEWKRRAEIRAYLSAIGERYAEDHPVGAGTVAFYLPERDVAITFDAATYFDIEGTDVFPILVEHEMPGMHLGARLPFETPDPDFGRSDDGGNRTGGVDAAFAVLGLGPDASLAEVKAAYRERVKETHPDHGGDPEAFKRVREAYDVARSRVS